MNIRSDRGTQFVNDIIKELLDLLQVEHERIMNAKVHDTIGVSPSKMLYGQAFNLYSEFISAIPPEFFYQRLGQCSAWSSFQSCGKAGQSAAYTH
jgi:hypothetical protein